MNVMRQSSFKIINLLFACYCCSVTHAYSQARNQQLHRLFETYYQESLQLDPISATFSGDHRYDDLLANDGAAPYLKQKYQFEKNTWASCPDITEHH